MVQAWNDDHVGEEAMRRAKTSEPLNSLRITAICGSLSEKSVTKTALQKVLEGAAEYDVITKLVDLKDYRLDFFNPNFREACSPDVDRLRLDIKEAHGIIIGSPEYHGSLSGVLKNMFDLMSIDDFEGKIVGLVGVAGGHTGAFQTLNTLLTITRNLHCWALPRDVSIAQSSGVFNVDGTSKDSQIENRLLDMGRQIVKLASMQRKVKEVEFMRFWEGLPTW